MRKICWLLMVVSLACACSEVDTKSCKIVCSVDDDCPSGLTCGDLGLCASSGETCSCTANEFIACNGDVAVFCSPGANGIANQACGAPSCNAEEQRCNACVIGSTTCSPSMMTLDHCGSDGEIATSDACAAGCVAASAVGDQDRCAYIQPAWLPDVCTDLATAPIAQLSGTLDVQQDAACTGGVVDLNGTTFCIVRASKIDIASLKVTGTRAIAFVADDELDVTGVLDVSADGPTPGPGAGILGAGTPSINASYKGGGGAGFVQPGGAGGGNDVGTEAGMAGGPITDRATNARFLGGASTTNALCGGALQCLNGVDFLGGGGGGGALLIACRGTVNVTGTVDAGGGGGTGGGDHLSDSAVTQGGAPGGGSGGFVVFQGVEVKITGSLYANGGGGGAGCSGDNCRGLPGADGLRSTNGAPGGDPAGNTCGGGIGGSATTSPGTGERTFSNVSAGSGGGGGSVGSFLVLTPNQHTPMINPAQASPVPQPGANLTIR